MNADELRRYLNTVHDSDAIPQAALQSYAAQVVAFEETIRLAARRLRPEDEPAAYVALIEELGRKGVDG
jgi:hypothetical protein